MIEDRMLFESTVEPEEPWALAASLCAWYGEHARDLPWRRDVSPYAVMLSEIMLQQTRVETVIPYFERFLARWPTIGDLAAADEEEVLREWAGLGYYSRARNLLKAARAASGGLPTTAAELRELPGIGAYTAGAIASIAFGRREPAVDGNVERVISRLRGISDDPKGKIGRQRILEETGRLYEVGPFVGEISAVEAGAMNRAATPGGAVDPGTLTQALMELGATVCSPKKPACSRCPWMRACVGAATNPEAHPNKAPKKAPTAVRAACAIWQGEGGLWMGRRPDGLLAGMWEPLLVEFTDGDPKQALADGLFERTGVRPAVGPRLGTVVHVFTHRRLTAEIYAVSSESAPEAVSGYTHVGLVDPRRPTVPLSTLAVKLCRAGTVDGGSVAG